MLLRRTVDTLDFSLAGWGTVWPRTANVRLEASTTLSQHFVMARPKCRVPPVLKFIYFRIIRPVCETEQTTKRNRMGCRSGWAQLAAFGHGPRADSCLGADDHRRSTQKAIPISNLLQHWYFSRGFVFSVERYQVRRLSQCKKVDRTVRGVRTIAQCAVEHTVRRLQYLLYWRRFASHCLVNRSTKFSTSPTKSQRTL